MQQLRQQLELEIRASAPWTRAAQLGLPGLAPFCGDSPRGYREVHRQGWALAGRSYQGKAPRKAATRLRPLLAQRGLAKGPTRTPWEGSRSWSRPKALAQKLQRQR